MSCDLTVKAFTFREAFGARFPDTETITGFAPSKSIFVPARHPNWKWDTDVLMSMCIWWESRKPDGLLLHGNPGVGKTGFIRQFCACLNIPLYHKVVNERTEFDDLVVRSNLLGNTTVASYQHLALAMGAEGQPGIFCGSELDYADANLIGGLHEVLDGDPVLVDIGGLDSVAPSQHFGVVATCNTAFQGDRTGQFVGTRTQGAAFNDRWVRVGVSDLNEQAELELLAEEIGDLPEDIRRNMVEVANMMRKKYMGDSPDQDALPVRMSTRTLIRWACWTHHCRGARRSGKNPVYYALDRAFTSGLAPELCLAVEKVVESKFGPKDVSPV